MTKSEKMNVVKSVTVAMSDDQVLSTLTNRGATPELTRLERSAADSLRSTIGAILKAVYPDADVCVTVPDNDAEYADAFTITFDADFSSSKKEEEQRRRVEKVLLYTLIAFDIGGDVEGTRVLNRLQNGEL